MGNYFTNQKPISNFCVLNLNISDIYTDHKFLDSLISLINVYDPNIICLQEVSHNIEKILKKELNKKYSYFSQSQYEDEKYCMIISAFPIQKYHELKLRLTKDKRLHLIKFNYDFVKNNKIINKKIIITTCNLNKINREKSNDIISEYYGIYEFFEKIYGQYDLLIFCTDTNKNNYFFKYNEEWQNTNKNLLDSNLILFKSHSFDSYNFRIINLESMITDLKYSNHNCILVNFKLK